LNRGDIVLVELPRSSTQGREQIGKRPAIIIQDEVRYPNTPTVIVIPVTSQKSALRFPATVLIQPTPNNGLQAESIALIFQVRAIDRKRVQQVLGTLEAQSLATISLHLRKITNL